MWVFAEFNLMYLFVNKVCSYKRCLVWKVFSVNLLAPVSTLNVVSPYYWTSNVCSPRIFCGYSKLIGNILRIIQPIFLCIYLFIFRRRFWSLLVSNLSSLNKCVVSWNKNESIPRLNRRQTKYQNMRKHNTNKSLNIEPMYIYLSTLVYVKHCKIPKHMIKNRQWYSWCARVWINKNMMTNTTCAEFNRYVG